MASKESPFEEDLGEASGQAPSKSGGEERTSPDTAAKLKSRHPSGADVFYLPRYTSRVGTVHILSCIQEASANPRSH